MRLRSHSLSRRLSSSSNARRFDKPVSESVRASDSWALISAACVASCFSACSSRCCRSLLAASIWSSAVKTAPLASRRFAVDAGQVGGDRLHLGRVVADVAGDILRQVGHAAGGHGGSFGRAF